MTKYTFTFDPQDENRFKTILHRLDPDEYSIIEDVKLTDAENPRYCDREAVIEMDPEACLTIRMGMGNSVKIRRERSEEEAKADAERDARHTITINVKVPGLGQNNP